MEHWKNKSLENIVEEIDGVVYTEKWVNINGYEQLYCVSSFGRIKSLGRRFYHSSLGYITTEDRIMAQNSKRSKYLEIGLRRNSKTSYFLVHRIVANAFHLNISEKETVNHKDGVRSNNFIDNLEWNTQAENLKHSFLTLGRKPVFQTYHDDKHPQARKIMCCTLGIEFKTMKDACKSLAVNRSALYKVCSGKLNHTKGLSFRYI